MPRLTALILVLAGCYQAPVGGSVRLTPSAPVSASTLRIELEEATDPNRNDRVEHKIYWYRNGEEQSGLEDARSVPSSATERGDRWSVVVVPNDGIYDGDAFEARTQILNEPPSVDEVQIAPQPVFGGQVISAEARASDGDADDVLSFEYVWTVNGEVQSREPWLSGFVRGDEVRLDVQVWDGMGGTDTWSSQPIRVKNRVPSAPVLRLSPTPLSRDGEVRCEIAVDSVDPDGDEVSYQFVWEVDGKPTLGGGQRVYRGDTLLASQVADASRLRCSVEARDHAEIVRASVDGFLDGPRVLLIYDTLEGSSPPFVAALADAGIDVTTSDVPETAYDGTNPAPDGFDAVIHLNGTTFAEAMPMDGQVALRLYVLGGGTFIHGSWNAYEAGSAPTLGDLTVTNHETGSEGAFFPVTRTQEHPLTEGLEPTFTIERSCGYGLGTAWFDATTVATVETSVKVYPAVAFREIGSGRSVGLAMAANYLDGCLADPAVQRLYINAARWSLQD